MTNMDAYQRDLTEVLEALEILAAFAPAGETKRAREQRKRFEEAAGKIRSTVSCMRNDYIPLDGRELEEYLGKRDISVDINNGQILSLTQEKHDGEAILRSGGSNVAAPSQWRIAPGDFVMLMNYYRAQKGAGRELF